MTEDVQRKTIRFEDLGEPVQRLLRSLKGGVTDEDMALLEYVAVKDMKTIYEKMASDAASHEIWSELREALLTRKEKAERKMRELDKRQEDIDAQLESQRKAAEEERRAAEAAEAERKARHEERRRARAEEADAAREAAEEEERRQQEEAEEKRREAKRKRREARARELAEEQEALRLEQEKHAKAKKKNQKKEWDDYVASHPLDFAPQQTEIKQVDDHIEHAPPPKTDENLLNRSYTPKCPNCFTKFASPPPEWECPFCLRRLHQIIKVWQPDIDHCMCCNCSVGRFTRHHCRSCGRVVCRKCGENKAIIPKLGYDSPVKVCIDCVNELAKRVVVN